MIVVIDGFLLTKALFFSNSNLIPLLLPTHKLLGCLVFIFFQPCDFSACLVFRGSTRKQKDRRLTVTNKYRNPRFDFAYTSASSMPSDVSNFSEAGFCFIAVKLDKDSKKRSLPSVTRTNL